MAQLTNKSHLSLLISYIFNIIVLFMVFNNFGDFELSVFYNSDTLGVPSLFIELFIEKSGIDGRHFSGAPYLFPDTLIFGFLYTIFQNLHISLFLFGIIQYFAILAIVNLILKELTISNNFIALANILFGAFLFTYLQGNDFMLISYLFLSGYHIGAYLMALVCLLLTLKFLKRGSYLIFTIILIIGVLSAISDMLFSLMFSIPMLLTSLFLFFQNKNRRYLLIAIYCVIFIGASFWWINFIEKSTIIHSASVGEKFLNFDTMQESFNVFKRQYAIFFKQFNARSITIYLTIIAFIFLLIKSIGHIFKHKTSKISQEAITFIFFIVLFTLIIFISPLANGSYSAFTLIRYNIHVFYIGLFNIAFILGYFYGDKLNAWVKYYSLALFAVILLIYISFTKLDKPYDIRHVLSYYPEESACIDKLDGKIDHKYGLGDFWNAKLPTYFSRKDFRVYPVHFNLRPYFHTINENVFFQNAKGKYPNPIYNFVILNDLDTSIVFKKLGKPKELILCNNTEIGLYDDFILDRNTREPVFINKSKP